MEKNNVVVEKNKTLENLTLTNRSNLKLDGLIEIISTSETQLNLKLKDTILVINGKDIHITKLDITTGIIEASGNFDSIKYGKSANILKRIFK